MEHASLIESRVVSAGIFDPRKSIFKHPANARAQCTTISCTLCSCPLRDLKTCSWTAPIGWDACPYGKSHVADGPTRRARSFSKWVLDQKKKYADVPHLGIPARKMAFIGDYVYLPYAHMAMNEAVPFLGHDIWFCNGIRFVPLTEWTVDTVCSLLDFRPQTMMGREIISYQQEVIPKFLLHVREADVAIWQALVAARPALNTTPNHVGREAILKTLKGPIEWTTQKAYPVTWRWDGQYIRTSSMNAYHSTWGGLKLDEVVVEGIPADDATIVVQDNAWVDAATVFMD